MGKFGELGDLKDELDELDLLKVELEYFFCLFVCLRLNFPVNNFSVILGRLPGLTGLRNGDKRSCSRTQHRP